MREQTGAVIRCAVLQLGRAGDEHEAFRIAARPRAGQLTRPAIPGCSADIGDKVIACAGERRSRRDRCCRRSGCVGLCGSSGVDARAGHFYLDPEGFRAAGSDPERDAGVALEFPISAVGSGGGRGCQRDGDIHRLTGSDRSGNERGIGSAHLLAGVKDQAVIRPCAGADVLQAPGLVEADARSKGGAIFDGNVRNELGAVTSVRLDSPGAGWRGRRRRSGHGWCGSGRCASACAGDDGIHPQGTVTGRRTVGGDDKNELDILTGERAQIQVDVIRQAFIFLTEGPEGFNRTGSDLIIEAVGDVTVRRSVFTANGRLEAVAALHAEGWIDRLHISVRDVIRREQQTRIGGSHTAFEFGRIQLDAKAVGAAISAGEG